LVGWRAEDMMQAAGTVMKALASSPQNVANQWMSFATEWGKIVTGQSELTPDPRDRPLCGPRLEKQQSAQGAGAVLHGLGQGGDRHGRQDRAGWQGRRAGAAGNVDFVDAMAPSNNPILNPTAMKTVLDSGGKSAVTGLKNFFDDMTKNGGLPSSVDASKFKVGENVANSPGTVVFRNDVLELVHYTATTEKVYQRPLLVVPPQINKYYSVDLSPDKSMIKFLTANGIQPYCVSWRNPTPAMAIGG
jgi:polyhydroxyalkanoate synthase